MQSGTYMFTHGDQGDCCIALCKILRLTRMGNAGTLSHMTTVGAVRFVENPQKQETRHEAGFRCRVERIAQAALRLRRRPSPPKPESSNHAAAGRGTGAGAAPQSPALVAPPTEKVRQPVAVAPLSVRAKA